FDLAEAGRDVVVVESATHVGGLMTQLDRTFPTDNCDLCSILPRLSANGYSQRIELLTMTRPTSVKGEVGNFTVSLTSSPRYIDLERCTACGECLRKLPECVRFAPGLDFFSPTCMRYPQASPQAFSIEMDKCADPDLLVKSCPAKAILLHDGEKTREEVFGSIILAHGADVFDPSGISSLGYGQHPDIVTSLEYERILSSSGPTQGQLVRPSNGRQPSKIAWIQCVGSRGLREHHATYCSSACCMFALKEIFVTKERFQKNIDACLFYMDMRTSGKDHELYYQRAKEELGARFIRCRTRNVIHNDKTNSLSITYLPDNDSRVVSEDFDMVVLSTGFRISESSRKLAQIMGVEINEHGFARTGSFGPVTASRPGIYVCGLFESPKDIAETITQASAAACLAAGNVAPSGVEGNGKEKMPPERNVFSEEPRVGVFICSCKSEADKMLDVNKLAADIRALPQVEIVEVIDEVCGHEIMRRIGDVLDATHVNRLVIAGSSPRILRKQFSDLLARSGLNRQLLEIANIREQNTWAHQNYPKEVAEKARDLIRMAVAGVKAAKPVAMKPLPINRDVLVVGGGVAGMTAALRLAEQRLNVYLVERSDVLGGTARNIRKTLEGEDVPAMVEELVKKTEGHGNIHVIRNAEIVDHGGRPGMFRTGVRGGPNMDFRRIEHGATIIANGALANRPPEYLLGEHAAVLTQRDADALIEDQPEKVKAWQKIVMIQCVGSRTPENPNCSRICCQAAVKNALRILDLNPKARIFVLYRDMRTSGLYEDSYREARGRGVIFFSFDKDDPPKVMAAGTQIRVTFNDPVLGREIALNADQLLLSTGFVADEESSMQLAKTFGLPRTKDGFFLEDNVKLMPVALPNPGFFVAGTAHGPKTIRESVAQGQAAAARILALLTNEEIDTNPEIACVDDKKCAACLNCVRVCPFDAPYITADGRAQIDATLCRGCGACAAECPAKAIQMIGNEDERILAKLEVLLNKGESRNGWL
ncbi:MAG: CoB--CoM heterodisulfide reductase iron-sulfur subunit A family protein, partial [Acidobacteria bacterium]|nr:CoB--CoM heterodisulfide reductase iron-sulfur subunit A family protein [Acidobacteriota bacterium]